MTCEDLQAVALRSFSEDGVIAPDMVIVSHGEQTAIGHEPGHGPISEGEAVIADLYPQDPVSGCYADMTRTFCMGEPPEELVRYHGLVKEALDLAVDAIRPGITGKELHRMTCDLFDEHGFPTQLTKDPDKPLEDGFFHSLGHGVGLEVHELPSLGRLGTELVAGDVLAVEPGLYRKGFGGCRLEDLVLVTDDGGESPDGLRLRARCLGLSASSFSKRSGSSNGPIAAKFRRSSRMMSCATRWMSSSVTASRAASTSSGSRSLPSSTSFRRPNMIIPFGSSSDRTRRPLEKFRAFSSSSASTGSAAMRPNSFTTVVTASSIRLMSTPPWA